MDAAVLRYKDLDEPCGVPLGLRAVILLVRPLDNACRGIGGFRLAFTEADGGDLGVAISGAGAKRVAALSSSSCVENGLVM